VDENVRIVREWLQSQPFELRLVTLILFMVEAVESEYGKEASKVFENELRDAYRKASGWKPKPN